MYNSRAAQPAEALLHTSAVQPVGSNNWYRLAFYNIGWLAASKKARHTKEGLATEICSLVQHKCVDAVGISEVFNLKEDMRERRRLITDHIVSKLNSSAAQPASSIVAPPAWRGLSDGHYIFLWNTKKLRLAKYRYVSCGINEQIWRKAQYLQFQCEESQQQPALHVCHNHSPSRKLFFYSSIHRCTFLPLSFFLFLFSLAAVLNSLRNFYEALRSLRKPFTTAQKPR